MEADSVSSTHNKETRSCNKNSRTLTAGLNREATAHAFFCCRPGPGAAQHLNKLQHYSSTAAGILPRALCLMTS